MKLTPLGKLLLFLIGLGLVATAVYRFVPPEQLPWNRPKAAPGTEPRTETRKDSPPAESPRPTADRPASNAPWIAVPGGLFASGPDQAEVDVPALSEQAKKRAEATIGCPIRLGEPHAQLVLSRSQWEAKLPSGDARLRQTLERHADDLMDERRSTRETTRNVRGVLTRQLSGGEPTIKAVAKELAMSSRTLQRQLAAEGTTYQALLDALRADLAKRHLAGGLGVSEVAFLLGYADGSAFARAFRRWFGKPPAEVRRP